VRNDSHREWIAGAIATLLGFYWQRTDPDDRLEEAMGKQWCDDLQPFPRDVIDQSIAAWRRNQHRKPCPAEIIPLCRERMPKPRLISAPEPERERVTAEQAKALLEANGFGHIVKRMPRSGDE
jgi:hypothetical protein